MYNFPFSYWVWFGTIYLVLLTWQDFRNNMKIDDRKNWFMMGSTISLYSHISHKVWFIFFVLALIISVRWYIMKFCKLGDGDANALSWIFLGFAIISIYCFAWFMIIFVVVSLLYTLAKLYVFKYKKPTPYFQVLLICFILNNLLWGFY